MAHYNVIFPLSFKRLTRRPRYKTDRVRLAGGHSQRNAAWSDRLTDFDADLGTVTLVQLATLENFHAAMFGGAHSFLIQDPADKTMTVEAIGTGDGSAVTFQLKRTYTKTEASPYTGDSNSDVRNIYKPQQGTLLVYVNAVLKTETTHYTVNYETGVITFTGGNTPPNGHVVAATCNYYLPVVLTDDAIESHVHFVRADGTGLADVPSVGFEEVRAFNG